MRYRCTPLNSGRGYDLETYRGRHLNRETRWERAAGRKPQQDDAFREALESGGEAIIRAIKREALKSDPTAMRLCMERLLPLAKAQNSHFRLPSVETAANLMEAISAVTGRWPVDD